MNVRAALAGVGVLLVLVSGGLSLGLVYNGDNYCGRVAWDTNRASPCGDKMRDRTIAAGGAAASGVVLLLSAARWRRTAILSVIGVALVLVALNRLLDPIHDPLCGSVLNSTSVPGCGPAFSSRRAQAAGLVTLAIASFGVAGWVHRRSLSNGETFR